MNLEIIHSKHSDHINSKNTVACLSDKRDFKTLKVSFLKRDKSYSMKPCASLKIITVKIKLYLTCSYPKVIQSLFSLFCHYYIPKIKRMYKSSILAFIQTYRINKCVVLKNMYQACIKSKTLTFVNYTIEAAVHIFAMLFNKKILNEF